MISGVDVRRTRDYVLKADKDDPTVWKLGVLPAAVAGLLVDNTKTGNPFEIILTIVRLALKGWENFKMDGKDIEFRTEKEKLYGREVDLVADDLVNTIPINAISELAIEIQKDLALTATHRKN